MALLPAVAGQAQRDEAAELSSSSISSPPVSPQNNGLTDTIRVAARPQSTNLDNSRGGVAAALSATSAQPSSPANSAQHTPAVNAQPEKPKRQRKKKELDPDGKSIDDGKPKEKKPRKPREPKAKTTTTTTTSTTTTTGSSQFDPPKDRKRYITQQIANATDDAGKLDPNKVKDVMPWEMNAYPALATAVANLRSQTTPQSSSQQQHTSNSPTPRPISSGRKYDPVRESAPPSSQPTASSITANRLSPHVNRASASPSIASLIDPPSVPSITRPSQSSMPQSFVIKSKEDVGNATHLFGAPALREPPSTQPPPFSNPALLASSAGLDGAMDLDPQPSTEKSPVVEQPSDIKASPKSSPTAPTPKPAIARSSPPAPKGTGSGLLSSSDLFGGPSSNDSSELKGVNIDIHISLNPNGGNHVNIAQEIMKKYGREAINPRAAAHRERLLQVMAAANKIDGGSADDMSVDLMSEADGDSNVEMTGMDEDRSAAQDTDKPRKRRKKTEEYDLDDEFIDDTELAWQQQAAVAKDGFFVYSGPLVPEGENARVESTTASSRGGRGRGRGRGRGASTAGTTHASLAEKKEPVAAATVTSGRGRGRTRGTGAPRKPRITKADKERMEAERLSRERTAANISAPSSTPTPASIAAPSTASPSQTAYSQQPQNLSATA